MDAGEYRFYYTLAQSQYQAGKVNLAQASLDQARKLRAGSAGPEDSDPSGRRILSTLFARLTRE